MCKREKTGNAAIELMQSVFQRASKEQERWMRKILKKSLAIGISVKSLNKIQPGFIPTFEVSLAQKFDMKRVKGDEVYVEPKLDGIRCLAIVEKGEAKLFTRAGKLITNFDSIMSPFSITTPQDLLFFVYILSTPALIKISPLLFNICGIIDSEIFLEPPIG